MVNRVNKSLVRSKMIIILELKLCLSNLSSGIERQEKGYRGTSVALILTRPVDLFLLPYF